MIITVITWFSGVARYGKMIRPNAGTRKASAVFTLNGDYKMTAMMLKMMTW